MRTEGKPAMRKPDRAVYDADFEESGTLPTVEQKAMVQTRTSYSTAIAVQKPRDLAKVETMVVREAALAAESFVYSYQVRGREGPSTIEGVSIDGAMIMARNWTNCATEVSILEDAPKHWMLIASFIDLETGFTETRLFRQRKSESHQKGDPERLLDIAFQIGQSKAKRNTIVRAMPNWLVDRAIAAAKQSAEQRVGELPAAIESVVRAYAKIGVTEARLVHRIGAPSAQWIPRDIVLLRAIGNAIKERNTTPDAEFPDPNAPKEETPAPPAVDAKPPAPPTDSFG